MLKVQIATQSLTCVRDLLIDFSRAFNTIIRYKLYDNIHLNVHDSICHLIIDFLLNRPLVVRFNNTHFASVTLAVQKDALSPHYYLLSLLQMIISSFPHPLKFIIFLKGRGLEIGWLVF